MIHKHRPSGWSSCPVSFSTVKMLMELGMVTRVARAVLHYGARQWPLPGLLNSNLTVHGRRSDLARRLAGLLPEGKGSHTATAAVSPLPAEISRATEGRGAEKGVRV